MMNKSNCHRQKKRPALLSFVVAVSAALMLTASAAQDVTYEYDGLGRLVETYYANSDKDVIYCYDAAGNRKIVHIGDSATPPPTDPSCYTSPAPPPPPPPPPFNGTLILVPLNGFTVIAVPTGP